MEYIEVETTKGIEKEIVYNVDDFPYTSYIDADLITKRKRGKYYNISVSFDIETTSLKENFENLNNEKPVGFMYHWQFCLKDKVCFGRTWEEFIYFMNMLKQEMQLGAKRTLVIYVHNLSFEFQFIKDFFKITSLFAKDKRKPMKMTIDGFEFRCSYFLSNMSLKKFCENSSLCYHYKSSGDLDYRKLRTPKTQLTMKEKGYCYNDVRGLCECIDSKLLEDDICSIPLTSTGYVRRDYRNAMKQNRNNRRIFKKTALNAHLYDMLKKAFRGGNTHANRYFSNTIMHNIGSYDIQSSYPTCIMMDYFPVGKFAKVHLRNQEKLDLYMENRCLLLDVSFFNISCKNGVVIPYIPINKCSGKRKIVNDNGRVLEAEYIRMCLTEIDLQIIRETYKYEGFIIHEAYSARRGKLPYELRNKMMDYYIGKTKLKDVDGKEYEYMKSKNKVNATFGMMVTDLLHSTIEYDQNTFEWSETTPTADEALKDFYNSYNNFLSYQWGVWVTAQARKRLQNMLNVVGEDVVYIDTDSIKFQNLEHIKQFDALNKKLIEQCETNDIPAYVDWKDKKGKPKRFYLGIWDFEGTYDSFKTLGAKKYSYEHIYKSGELELHDFHITVSGMGKEKGRFRVNSINNFNIGKEYHDIGRTTSWYNDVKPHKITVNGDTFTTASNIAVLETTYTLGVTNEYWELILDNPNEINEMDIFN